ncbi:hypothetical protein [Micromonospora auratinigra]|uniref:Uncharacterized protein n=1 Tax=Micromonospora auratinigra TaxID=261654 RepID=A0A1A8ZXH9_9ACTN|nr:hypothetical protein [Micromonospora auratinigra]SBT48842.1 hypothetical protein GA0070611_4205 [Micromonospora auratinigra]
MGRDDRVGTALLAGLTVAALVTGGWWWHESAPRLGPVDPSPGPTPGAFGDRDVKVVDPATGRVLRTVPARPKEPLVLFEDADGAAAVPLEAGDDLWHDRSHLEPGQPPVVRQTNPSAGLKYALTVRCTGTGSVAFEATGTPGDEPPASVECGYGAAVSVLEAAGGPLRVRFRAEGGGADLDARLAELS